MHVSGDRVLYPAALYANGWMEGLSDCERAPWLDL